MTLSQEKFSMYQDAPITSWEQHRSIYDNAYQGARYDYSLGSEVCNEYLRSCSSEEKNVIVDWIYAVTQAEKKLLTKPFETWTFEDLATLSAWLTRSTCPQPGSLRTNGVKWLLRKVTTEESKRLDVLASRKLLSSHSQEEQEKFKKDPVVIQNPSLLTRLTPQEEKYLKQSVYTFPIGDAIEEGMRAALKAAQEESRRLSKLTWLDRQKAALKLGCTFHVDIVRIHPFTEGSKRLGRLCMFIIHAQNGLNHACIEDAQAYKNALQECLKEGTSKPFERFFCEAFEKSDQQLKAIASLAGNERVLNPQAFGSFFQNIFKAPPKTTEPLTLSCANCKKQNTDLKRCGGCKKVFYCNAACQSNHWKTEHKQICKQ